MKKKIVLALIASSLLMLGLLQAAQDCGTTAVLAGCVGDTVIDPTCVQAYSATYTVTAVDVAASPGNVARFCLITTATSLCPSHSAIATVSKNGGAARSADLNNEETLEIKAKEGDVIQVDVTQVPRNNGIVCFRQGDLQFELVR